MRACMKWSWTFEWNTSNHPVPDLCETSNRRPHFQELGDHKDSRVTWSRHGQTKRSPEKSVDPLKAQVTTDESKLLLQAELHENIRHLHVHHVELVSELELVFNGMIKINESYLGSIKRFSKGFFMVPPLETSMAATWTFSAQRRTLRKNAMSFAATGADGRSPEATAAAVRKANIRWYNIRWWIQNQIYVVCVFLI